MMQRYMLDNPDHNVVFMGEFNIHNKEWLVSKVDTDEGGSIAQEFCELFGFNQYVDFETRSCNTLDLVISPYEGSAAAVAA